MCLIKAFRLSFVLWLSLRFWSRRFDRVLQVFIRWSRRFTGWWLVYHEPRSWLVGLIPSIVAKKMKKKKKRRRKEIRVHTLQFWLVFTRKRNSNCKRYHLWWEHAHLLKFNPARSCRVISVREIYWIQHRDAKRRFQKSSIWRAFLQWLRFQRKKTS